MGCSPESMSSTSATDFARPTSKGATAPGKSTAFRIGRMGSSSSSGTRSASSGEGAFFISSSDIFTSMGPTSVGREAALLDDNQRHRASQPLGRKRSSFHVDIDELRLVLSGRAVGKADRTSPVGDHKGQCEIDARGEGVGDDEMHGIPHDLAAFKAITPVPSVHGMVPTVEIARDMNAFRPLYIHVKKEIHRGLA